MTPKGGVPIEQLQKGDTVYAVDMYGERSEVQVHELIIHYDNPVSELETEVGVLRTTYEHAFWLGKDDWASAGTLKAGDKVVHVQDDTLRYVSVVEFRSGMGRETVYNLEVDEPHTYLVDGIVVHNAYGKSPPPSAPGPHPASRGDA